MEKVKKQNMRNILLLVFISIAILMLVIHLVIQMIETNAPYEEITLNKQPFPESPAKNIKTDSIWHNTEFVQN